MTGPEIFSPDYYERLRRLEAGGWWNAAMRDILGRAIESLSLPASGLLVDVGCGSGEALAWFGASHPGWQAVGVDLAWEGLRAVPVGPSVGAVRASALALPLPAACADVVVSQDLLQHLPLDGGDARALAEIRRILKAGAAFVLRTNAQSTPRTEDDEQYQFHRYETRELRRKLMAAGFRVERIGRVNAALGLAEIPREWRALQATGRAYHGVLAAAPEPGRLSALDQWKRRWLRMEGLAMLRGWSLPFGRTHVAVCRALDGAEHR
ncbi:MAG: class I SAM-dependent methyltransferase [Acidobacteriota bacterium]